MATFPIFSTFPAPYFNGNLSIPLIGGVIGVLLYDWFIGDILQARRALAEHQAASASAAGSHVAPPTTEPGPAEEEGY